MKLNDLISRIDENADSYADRKLLNGGTISHLFHLTINSEKFEMTNRRRPLDEEYKGVYFRVDDVKDKPYMTTLPQYKNYIVDDYTVEYDSRKNYDDLNLHIYLDIRLKERTYPTLEEFMNTYLKDVPESTVIDDRDKYTSILVYKGETYPRSPDMLFKFRHYKVHKCYRGQVNFGTRQEPRRSHCLYVIFLRKQEMKSKEMYKVKTPYDYYMYNSGALAMLKVLKTNILDDGLDQEEIIDYISDLITHLEGQTNEPQKAFDELREIAKQNGKEL